MIGSGNGCDGRGVDDRQAARGPARSFEGRTVDEGREVEEVEARRPGRQVSSIPIGFDQGAPRPPGDRRVPVRQSRGEAIGQVVIRLVRSPLSDVVDSSIFPALRASFLPPPNMPLLSSAGASRFSLRALVLLVSCLPLSLPTAESALAAKGDGPPGASAVEAAGPLIRWDFRSQAVYEGEDLHLHGRSDAARLHWIADDAAPVPLPLDTEGAFRLDLTVGHDLHRLRLQSDDRSVSVALLRPGDHRRLVWRPAGLQQDGVPVILALPRRELQADRRWGLLRSSFSPERDRSPCRIHWRLRQTGERGDPALLQLLASDPGGPIDGGVLIELPGRDVYAGWQQRSYRQCLAWLVSDLQGRGARRIVLVQPPVIARDQGRAAALWRALEEVAGIYHCDILRSEGLSDERYWRLAPGILGLDLNDAGRGALQQAMASELGDRPDDWG